MNSQKDVRLNPIDIIPVITKDPGKRDTLDLGNLGVVKYTRIFIPKSCKEKEVTYLNNFLKLVYFRDTFLAFSTV